MKESLFRNRISWTAIFAGLIVGILVFLVTINLGIFLLAIFGVDLVSTSIAGIIWAILSLIVSSYVAGLVAAMTLNPNEKYLTVEQTEEEIETSIHRYRKQTKITGLITGSLIVLVTTYLTVTGLGSLLSGATKIVGGSAVAVTGVAGAGVAGAAGLTNIDEVRNYVSNISREDVENLISDNIDGINDDQVSATANVLERVFRTSARDLQNTNIRNISEKVSKNYEAVKQKLTGADFVARLQAEGLTAAEAQEIQTKVQKVVDDFITETQKAIDTAVETIRNTTAIASISWIIYALVVLGFTILGAMTMKHTKESIAKKDIK